MKIMPIAPGGAPSGSYAGITASHNRYGYYLRSKVIPTNPSTERQQFVRNVFRALSRQWSSTCTAAQRTAWDLYGANIAKTDSLGNQFYLPGFNWFVGNNTAIVQAGLSAVYTGPTTLTLPAVDPSALMTLTSGSGNGSLAFDTDMDWLDEDDAGLIVKMSQPHGVGTTYVQGPFRYAGVVLGDAVTAPTSPASIALPFAVAESQVVTIACRIIRADGRVSSEFKHTVSVGS